MRIVVIGGTGLIGKRLVRGLREAGQDAVAASASTGMNVLTGEGVPEALAGAQVVVDVTNSPSFEPGPVLDFFLKSAANLLPAEKNAGVRHHVALSVVGADRLPDLGYMKAKVAQEEAIKASGLPYTIVRATQFFEFLPGIADAGAKDGAIHASTALLQPIAADDVAIALTEIAQRDPLNGTVELAGPERSPLDQFVRRMCKATDDARPVVSDAEGLYFGAKIDDRSLTPGENPMMGRIRLDDWLKRQGRPG